MHGPDPPVLLLIDDNASGLAIRQTFLQTVGYVVHIACSGSEGLKLARQQHVDAVILDYRMPRMDGGEVARRLRRLRPRLPIVMLTGFAGDVPHDVVKLVDSLIAKGSAPGVLLHVLQNELGLQPAKPTANLEQVLDKNRKQVQSARKLADGIRRSSRKQG